MTPCGDSELVQQSLSGDREAFGQIVSRCQSLIYSLGAGTIAPISIGGISIGLVSLGSLAPAEFALDGALVRHVESGAQANGATLNLLEENS